MHTRQGVAVPALSQDSSRPHAHLTPAELVVLSHTPVQLSAATGMYPREVNLNGTTRHSRYCKATPRRRDWSCHRCCELMTGAAPRGGGWQRSFFGRKLGQRNFLFTK